MTKFAPKPGQSLYKNTEYAGWLICADFLASAFKIIWGFFNMSLLILLAIIFIVYDDMHRLCSH